MRSCECNFNNRISVLIREEETRVLLPPPWEKTARSLWSADQEVGIWTFDLSPSRSEEINFYVLSHT
jgi:hypothetical protein